MTERRNENQTGSKSTIGELLDCKFLLIAPFGLFTGGSEKDEKSDQIHESADCRIQWAVSRR